jgi:hypothetical protein
MKLNPGEFGSLAISCLIRLDQADGTNNKPGCERFSAISKLDLAYLPLKIEPFVDSHDFLIKPFYT